MGNKQKDKKWMEETSVKFINPYSFVKFPEKAVRSTVTDGKKLTGSITCWIYTETPIFIPDTEQVQREGKDGHKVYDFFSYDGKTPIIPGSSIRGMVRSLFETVTDSCVHRINDSLLSARDPLSGSPGILSKEGDKWKLYKAKRYSILDNRCILDKKGEKWRIKLETEEDWYENGETIQFQSDGKNILRWRKKQDGKETNDDGENDIFCLTGTLLLWEDFEKKKKHSVFQKKEYLAEIEQEKIDLLKETITMYYENNKDVEKRFYENSGYMELLENGCNVPVWYKESNGIYYFSPACIGRWVLNNKIRDFLGDLMPCSSRNSLCEACALFGMVKEDFNGITNSIGSKLRFSDGILEDSFENIFVEDGKYIELKPLASPHITAMEFYTKRPQRKNGKADIWNYDYSINYNCRGQQKNEIIEVESSFLNGRKYYWHHPISVVEEQCYKKNQEDKNDNKKVNISAKLVNRGKKFKFTVYYDGITNEQRQKLLWVLCLGENREDSNYCYKLGHGKPIGLGSVKIVIDDVKERQFSLNQYQYKSISRDSLEKSIEKGNKLLWGRKDKEDNGRKKQLMELLDKTYIDLSEEGVEKLVSYPIGDNGEGKENSMASHQWFVGNKAVEPGSEMKPIIRYTIRENMEKTEQRSLKYEFPKMIKKEVSKEKQQKKMQGSKKQNFKHGRGQTSTRVSNILKQKNLL